jgi:inosine-uridine nucleoside N-ribohydrolase
MAQKVILDVDTGADDAVALLLAGHHPALELVAVTVTHGNAPLAVTLDNTLRVLAAGGLGHVPVFAGAARALVASPPPTTAAQAATLPLPATDLAPQAQPAASFLSDYYAGPEGASTCLVLLGPQTNLAVALGLAGRLATRIPRIVTMAGAYLEGNLTPSAEFNVLADPEAARCVFNAGIPLTMVGLEVTGKARIGRAEVERLHARPTSQGRAAAALVDFMHANGWSFGEIYDACAVAAVADPGLLQTQAMHVDVELYGELTRGRTVADMFGWFSRPPNVAVGTGIDRERFIQVLFEAF